MAKSKEQKRKEAIQRAKEHYRRSALPDYLRFNSPRKIEIDLQPDLLETTISNALGFSVEWTEEDIKRSREASLRRINRDLMQLVRQANLAEVDLDGCDVTEKVNNIQFDNLDTYRRFYNQLKKEYDRTSESGFGHLRVGSWFNNKY